MLAQKHPHYVGKTRIAVFRITVLQETPPLRGEDTLEGVGAFFIKETPPLRGEDVYFG